jgi:hypothetical protein
MALFIVNDVYKPTQHTKLNNTGNKECKVWLAFRQFMKNGVFWDVIPCDSCKNRRFGGA